MKIIKLQKYVKGVKHGNPKEFRAEMVDLVLKHNADDWREVDVKVDPPKESRKESIVETVKAKKTIKKTTKKK